MWEKHDAEGERGMESRRGMMGSESQAGRADASSVLVGFNGAGCAWRRRVESWRQWGRGEALI